MKQPTEILGPKFMGLSIYLESTGCIEDDAHNCEVFRQWLDSLQPKVHSPEHYRAKARETLGIR